MCVGPNRRSDTCNCTNICTGWRRLLICAKDPKYFFKQEGVADLSCRRRSALGAGPWGSSDCCPWWCGAVGGVTTCWRRHWRTRSGDDDGRARGGSPHPQNSHCYSLTTRRTRKVWLDWCQIDINLKWMRVMFYTIPTSRVIIMAKTSLD